MTTPSPDDYNDTRTYIDEAGVERWTADDIPVSQNNAFRRANDGEPLAYLKLMEYRRQQAQKTSRVVDRRRRDGVDGSILGGMSNKADARLRTHNQLPQHWAVR